ERLFEPLLSGIFAGDGARLSLLATFPQLREFEKQNGGMLRGVSAARARMRKTDADSRARARAGFLSFPGGMQELVDALEQELRTAAGRVDIKLNTRVERIERDSVGAARYTLTLADGSVVHADAVIVATPAHIAARLLEH